MSKMGEEGFIWFIGIADDIVDPLKNGRIKVRIPSEHGVPGQSGLKKVVETADLPWATVMMPVTSASFDGVGTSPTGIFKGSYVVGFYLDPHKNIPMIMGTFNLLERGNDKKNNDVAKLARGDGPVPKDYLDYEPESKYAAVYPFNKTMTTVSGHVIEVDDTPKSERLHVYHTSGTYIEISPDGTIVTKSAKDNIDITIGDKNIVVESGDMSIVAVNGKITIQAKGDVEISSGGTLSILAPLVSING
jgi:hypothetical protein